VIIGYAALSLAQIRFSGSQLAALLVTAARQGQEQAR